MSWSKSELGCDRCVDAAAYVLGALEETEAIAYRAHMDECLVCMQEVAELQPVVDELPSAVVQMSAPDQLREGVMATVRAEASLLHAAGSEADQPIRSRAGWLRRPIVGFAGAATALAMGLVIGLFVFAGGAGQSVHVTTAKISASAVGASAVLRQVGSRSELNVANMPAPPMGRIYEVWLQRGSGAPQPTDALFSVTRQGSGTVNIPGNLIGVSRVMVTAEPFGGSSVPTRTPVIVVTLT